MIVNVLEFPLQPERDAGVTVTVTVSGVVVLFFAIKVGMVPVPVLADMPIFVPLTVVQVTVETLLPVKEIAGMVSPAQ